MKWSLPVRECGLKSKGYEAWLTSRSVTPRAGVWIEICRRLLNKGRFTVTPRAGVWIEIDLLQTVNAV